MGNNRQFIEEALKLIREKALQNQYNKNLFVGLCDMLKALEDIAKESLDEGDELLKEISDLKKIVCKNDK